MSYVGAMLYSWPSHGWRVFLFLNIAMLYRLLRLCGMKNYRMATDLCS